MLAEAKELPSLGRFRQLGRNYMLRCYTSSNHPMVQLLRELSNLVDNPERGGKEQPLISEYYKTVTPLSNNPIRELSQAFNYTYRILFYKAIVSFDEGRQIKEAKDHKEYKKIFQERMRTSKCFAMNGTKMKTKPFVGFASLYII
jgi:hypothetical protein